MCQARSNKLSLASRAWRLLALATPGIRAVGAQVVAEAEVLS